jgi:hypothetical protein
VPSGLALVLAGGRKETGGHSFGPGCARINITSKVLFGIPGLVRLKGRMAIGCGRAAAGLGTVSQPLLNYVRVPSYHHRLRATTVLRDGRPPKRDPAWWAHFYSQLSTTLMIVLSHVDLVSRLLPPFPGIINRDGASKAEESGFLGFRQLGSAAAGCAGMDDHVNLGVLGRRQVSYFRHFFQDRRQLRYELDLNSWNLRIWGVAASGFLTDSYVLRRDTGNPELESGRKG